MTPWEQVSVTVFCAVLASSGLWSIILFRMQRKEREAERKSTDSVECKALKALLHDRICSECNAALTKGTISPDDYNNLRYMYDPYVSLNGNGTAKRLMIEVEKLPLDINKKEGDSYEHSRSGN